jgi:23S rRNA (guanosine2251-2'-O)-methyltransferase
MSSENTIFIFGKNAVMSALEKRADLVERIFLVGDKKTLEKTSDDKIFAIQKLAHQKKISQETMLPHDLSRELQTANHQGVLAKVRVTDLTINIDFFLDNLEIDANTCLLILGELEDVQNVGSIIRSASAFGVAGILIPEHNQAQITGTVIKISAGTAFSIPLVKIKNVNNAIEKLKEKRFWVYGLDMFGEKSIYEEQYTEPTVFVIGNEGEGIREKTKDACDMLLNIPISQEVESLNAAVSTAITLYEWRRQKLTK